MFKVGDVVTINPDGHEPVEGSMDRINRYKLHPVYKGVKATLIRNLTQKWSPAPLWLASYKEPDDSTNVITLLEKEIVKDASL